MTRAAALCAAALAGLVPSPARAYPLYWIGTQAKGAEFAWEYSGKGSSGQAWTNDHATAESVRAAIAAPFVDFSAGAPAAADGSACSTLALVEVTPEGGATLRNEVDGHNVHGIFVSSYRDALYPYIQGGVVAYADPQTDDENYVTDCDTVYNAVDMPFATDSDGNSIDLQNVAQQETAHCFGLHHVCQQSRGDGQPSCDGADVDEGSVMYPFATEGSAPQHPDGRDQDNMCQIYPTHGVGRPCDPWDEGMGTGFTTPDCGEGFSCHCSSVGAICTRACSPGSGDAPCPDRSVCDPRGFCVPDFYPDTAAIGEPTRTGDTCIETPDGHAGLPPTVPVSQPCHADADCGPGVCIMIEKGGYCSLDCSAKQCPSGSSCFRDVLGSGDAYCLADCRLTTGSCNVEECRNGLACQYVGSRRYGACWFPCRTSADCDPNVPPAQKCDTSNGVCYNASRTPFCTGPGVVDCHSTGCPEGESCSDASGLCESGVTPVPDGGLSDGSTGATDGGDPVPTGDTGLGAPDTGSTGTPPPETGVADAGARWVPAKVNGLGCGCGSANPAEGGLVLLALCAHFFSRRTRTSRS